MTSSPDRPVAASSETRARAERVLAADPSTLVEALHGRAGESGAGGDVLGVGAAASPGIGSGPLVTTFDAALDAADRGEEPVLVLDQTGPADEPAMRVAAAVLTSRGGLASHAAVVARAWGLPAVCGLETLVVDEHGISVDGRRVGAGEWLTVDGSSGEVRVGRGAALLPTGLGGDWRELLADADALAGGRPAVWANADDSEQARLAFEFGAMGVGLCRTEHQFLGARLPLFQSVLLGGAADDAAELERLQRDDIARLLVEAGGRPVVVRLFDPPVHEFLPKPGEPGATDALLAAAEAWFEHNPMLGVRGVRLASVVPEVVRLQVRAAVAASEQVRSAGTVTDLRLLVPMVAWPSEVTLVADLVAAEAARTGAAPLPVGAMVETPAAAVRSAELAGRAAFLSIGSNDLTQLTLGLSRDDTEVRLLSRYREHGLIEFSPFERLDAAVVELVERAVADAPSASWSMCGEHAADEWSLRAARRAGVGVVSCSPYRVPMARLAAGRAAAADLLGEVA